jgi:multidrug efflux pump subunit AcrA (membrane-fusion protein)
VRIAPSQAIIAVMGLVIAVLIWTLVYFARDELRLDKDAYEEEIAIASTASEVDGRPVVRVSRASQAASGIAVQPLQSASSEDVLEVYGAVVGIQPLLELRGRYLAALGEVRSRQAAVRAAQAEYERMRLLYNDDRNVSEQALRAAESRFHSESAQLASAQATVDQLDAQLRNSWGEVVAGWTRTQDSSMLRALLERRSHLIQLSFPYDVQAASAARGSLAIAPVSGRNKPRPARYVSEAPQSEAVLPGQTYFYLAEGGDLRAGTRVVARAGLGGKESGVLVPGAAVVWHAGKSWVYVKQDAELFARFPVGASHELGGGWFQPAGDLKPGDEVVVSGAQLLLSEELKFQIRNENED